MRKIDFLVLLLLALNSAVHAQDYQQSQLAGDTSQKPQLPPQTHHYGGSDSNSPSGYSTESSYSGSAQPFPSDLTFQDSKGPNHGRHRSSSDSGVRNNEERYDGQWNEIQDFIVFITVAATLISIVIGVVLGYKCMKRRSLSAKIKEQMQVRRAEYSSSVGMNLFEMNNRLPPTVHL